MNLMNLNLYKFILGIGEFSKAIFALSICTIFLLPPSAVLASESVKYQCAMIFDRVYGPIGKLSHLNRASFGSQPAMWAKDEMGTNWYLKRDKRFSELQTSAEVISSAIYRELGYDAPEVVIYYENGVRFSAAKELSKPLVLEDRTALESKFRQLRLLASYLKDWDILSNISYGYDYLQVYDFGGSLGARAHGEHKEGTKLEIYPVRKVVPDKIFSNAIGGFMPWLSSELILAEFNPSIPESHPWNNLNENDIREFVSNLEKLTPEKIRQIVKSAKYSQLNDEEYMVEALRNRRIALIEGLREKYIPHRSNLANYLKHKSAINDSPPITLVEKEIRVLQQYIKESLFMNNDLWNQSKSDSIDPYFVSLNQVLDKLPNFSGIVFREPKPREIIRDKYLNKYDSYLAQLEPGRVIVHKGYTSTTKSGNGSGKGWSLDTARVVLIIQSKTGKDISHYSQVDYEEEVLFKPGTKFKVLSKEYDTFEKKWYVLMEEVK